ncbi:MAG TPA: chromate transporter [Micropepsaceae bacterium]|nr:chromate transporter [Micropepsaceae bacterium]
MNSDPLAKAPRVPLLDLMSVFFRVGVASFGGSTAAWLYRELVERRGWLDEEHFLTALTLAQVLPGANPVNLSIYVGSQLRGGIGGAAAALGMVGPPFCIILALGYLYRAYGASAVAHAVLGGLAAVGVGMTLSIGFKLARKVRKPMPTLIAVALFVIVGLLHWPMIPVVLVLTPLSIGLERYAGGKAAS